jgi:hypothetical protein
MSLVTATDVLRRIVATNPGIAFVTLTEYSPRRRVKDSKRRGSPSTSLHRRLSQGGGVAKRMSRARVLRGALDRLVRNMPRGTAIAVSSTVRLKSGRTAHIPQMDFSIHARGQALRELKDALQIFQERGGALLVSGESYHYYGATLLRTHRDWRQFLGKCLLIDDPHSTTPLVDVRYVGHCLVAGETSLRVSARRASVRPPHVVAWLGAGIAMI